MKVLIFTTNMNKGRLFLEYLIGDIKYKDIKDVAISMTQSKAILKDGTEYIVVNASNNSRGHKCDIAYVDYSTPIEILDKVIKPCLVYSKLHKEEERIIFF